jgi:hypothetical protein
MHSPRSFDPNSPFAFAPPAYDSLPKEPPKYVEIFGEGVSADNPAYVSDGAVASSSNSPIASVHRQLPHRKRTISVNTPNQGQSRDGDVTIPLSPDARNNDGSPEPSTPPPPYSAQDESITMPGQLQVTQTDQACVVDSVTDQQVTQATPAPPGPTPTPQGPQQPSTDAVVDMTPAHSSVG